jgi:hypothetical protein
MRIAEPARRHGMATADIWHAVRNAMRRLDNEVTILIGTARDGALLEIGVLDIDGDDPVIVHAMPLRRRFHPYL